MKSRTRLISAYTPSNTDPEVLKRIFVQREGILERLVNRLERALLGSKNYHALLVGPRGSGKTHLVTMAVHELGLRQELRNEMRIAWLGEDDTFTGLIDIALGMGDRLADRYPNEFPVDFRAEVRGLNADDAAEAILTRILERSGEAHVLLVMENLNRAFGGLGDSGQKQFRALLQNRGQITILGTSQQLFKGIGSRDRPFFGFFDITHLRPLSVDDALELIHNIAREEGNEELAQFLETPEGRFRVRALHHLAGGNHRLYVQLSEFLTKDSLEDLVAAFEQIEEELTPYFQERLRTLAPQQARIVECLCGAPGAMSVKQIHEETFIPERSCSKQLGLLKKMQYVRGTSSGKETYYELSEPLLRLCLEVKHRRGAPLELVVQFIRAWFPQDELKLLHDRHDGQSPCTSYLDRALVQDGTVNRLLFESLSLEVDQKLAVGEGARAAELREELAFITSKDFGLVPNAQAQHLEIRDEQGRDGTSGAAASAQIDVGIERAKGGDLDAAIVAFSVVIEQVNAAPDQVARARVNRGIAHGQQGDTASEIADYTAVIEQADAPPDKVAEARINRGIAHGQQGDTASEIADYTAVIEQADAPPDQVARARINRGITYGQQDNVAGAIADFTVVIEQVDAAPNWVADARINRGITYGQQGNVASAIADYTAVIEQADAPPDKVAEARINRGITYGQQGELTGAIADLTAIIEAVDASPEQVAKARVNRGVAFGQQGDLPSAIADFTTVVERLDAPPNQVALARINRGITSGRQGNVAREIGDYTAVIEQSGAPPDHVARARVNRGVSFGQHGDVTSAIADFTAVIEQVGAAQDQVAEARINRGVAYGQKGDLASEIADYTAVIMHVDASPDRVANAHFNRGSTCAQQGDLANAITDYTAVIEQIDAPPDQVAMARVNRGFRYSQQGDTASAIADYTAVIEQIDAPPDQVAMARVNRGFGYSQQGDTGSAIADYTAVIEQIDAPPDQVAMARVNRGFRYSQQGDTASAIADYTAVIEQVDSPTDQVASARINRGVCKWRSGDYADSEVDFRAVLDDPRHTENDQSPARFAITEPMIMTSAAPAVADALAEAFRLVPRESPSYGGTPEDVVATLLRRGHQDWDAYLRALGTVYLANDYASDLGTAAVRSAGAFDGGDYSVAQMDTWLAAWKSAANDNEQLGTSVGWLAAALEAIKSKSDRPLLSIPLEIRTLIRPLLSKSLGPVKTTG